MYDYYSKYIPPGTTKMKFTFSNENEMVSVEEIEGLFNVDQTETATPDISFDPTPNTSMSELYTPTEFLPLNESFDEPPINAPSPSSLGSPPPRIITGRSDRFIPGSPMTSSVSSLDLESPEEKVSFFTRKKNITRPIDYEPGNTDWQYNSHLRAYEYRPGMDFYATRISQFEIEAKSYYESQWMEDDSE